MMVVLDRQCPIIPYTYPCDVLARLSIESAERLMPLSNQPENVLENMRSHANTLPGM